MLLLGSLLPVGVSAAAEAGPTAPAPGVVAGDRLTAQFDRVPLPLVLAEVACPAGLRVWGGDAAGDLLVSASFQDLPLAEGLQRLLGGQPHVLAYARAPADAAAPTRWRISEVVVPSRAQRDAADQPPGDPRTPALADPDPQVRTQALEAWVQQRQGDAVDPLTHALVDPDEQVRARAQALWERLLETQAATPASH
jgi:hypothetical protein